jgi:hypothetical protein
VRGTDRAQHWEGGYANDHVAPVRIAYKRIEASDGRLKRVILYDAEDISEEE